MTRKPNSFPREGQHQIVTRDAVEAFEQERPTLDAALHYTIDGPDETQVHSSLNAEREAAITNGSRRLAKASEALAQGMQRTKPDARAEYIRMHRQAAAKGHKRLRSPKPTQSR